MTQIEDFAAKAHAAADSARALSGGEPRELAPQELNDLLEAIEVLASTSSRVLGTLRNGSSVAAGELPPLEELTRLLTQAGHRARVVRNRFNAS